MQAPFVLGTYLKKTFPYHAVISIFLFFTLANTYTDMDMQNKSSQDLLFVKTTIPAFETPFDVEFAIQTYVKNVVGMVIQSPLSYVHTAMPFTKKLPIKFKNGGITGFFSVPEIHEIINLDKNNEFTPSYAEPEPQDVNTGLLNNYKHLLASYYTGDASLKVDAELLEYLGFDFEELAAKELKINTDIDGPHVLLFHTHAFELYDDEKGGYYADHGVVKVAQELERILEAKYGLNVLHVDTMFTPSTTNAYEAMEPVITQIIDDNPSIQLAIDIHRDGMATGASKVTAKFNGEDTAKIMFVNGISLKRNMADEILPHNSLENPYLEENMALSLQAYIQGLTYYPDLMRTIFLKSYRYSTHMLPYSMLVEIGFNTNTSEEALNAVEPFADIIGKVFNLE
ncbi:stage II sporulation protein P [Candidatus Epulonipiscium viviparus]|uniref:SpoIIP n=1 Tax=Candidatus Epulonipiscium viviparus TaxID=420336 RepID=G9HVZ4_9FIRM|nr:stage II sporulation protein P [Candidatus Epulopiscium viviparus]AEW47911.1 SpoIIP [Candidatus Epulopiscium viviparus]